MLANSRPRATMSYVSTQELPYLFSNCHTAIHFNARSLRKHYDEFHSVLSLAGHPFSIICISESWLKDSDKNLYCFPSYSAEYCHRTTSSYGGSAIFIFSDIGYRRRHDLSLNVADCESVWIELDKSAFGSDGRNTIFGSIYRSPSSSLPNFCNELSILLQSATSENKNIVVMGDININILDTNSPCQHEYLNCFNGYGFESLIDLPTRCPPDGSGTLIDHAFTNLLSPPNAFILRTDITDHYPIALRFHCLLPKRNTPSMKSLLDKIRFSEQIANANWSSVYSCENAQTSYTTFSSMVGKCLSASTTLVFCKKKICLTPVPLDNSKSA